MTRRVEFPNTLPVSLIPLIPVAKPRFRQAGEEAPGVVDEEAGAHLGKGFTPGSVLDAVGGGFHGDETGHEDAAVVREEPDLLSCHRC